MSFLTSTSALLFPTSVSPSLPSCDPNVVHYKNATDDEQMKGFD